MWRLLLVWLFPFLPVQAADQVGEDCIGALETQGFYSSPVLTTPTPNQLRGPFMQDVNNDLVVNEATGGMARGTFIVVTGFVRYTDGSIPQDVRIELWNADKDGRYPHDADPRGGDLADGNLQPLGFAEPNANGVFAFRTIRPGPYPVGANWTRPGHLHFSIRVDGEEVLVTQAYFQGDPLLRDDHIYQDLTPEGQAAVTIEMKDQWVPWGAVPNGVPVGRLDFVLPVPEAEVEEISP